MKLRRAATRRTCSACRAPEPSWAEPKSTLVPEKELKPLINWVRICGKHCLLATRSELASRFSADCVKAVSLRINEKLPHANNGELLPQLLVLFKGEKRKYIVIISSQQVGHQNHLSACSAVADQGKRFASAILNAACSLSIPAAFFCPAQSSATNVELSVQVH